MINNIEQYLAELKKELAGSDRATIQDALADAEEYLRTAMSGARSQNPAVPEPEALSSIIAKYGEPAEVAAAYKEIESRTVPGFGTPVYREKEPAAEAAPAAVTVKDTRPFIVKVFGVYTEPKAWGALFYLLLSLATGIVYFTWAVTGISLTFGLLFVFLFGILFGALFLLSVRGIALVEGRLVEALLGVRMPRRQTFAKKNGGWLGYFKNLVTDGHTWLSIIYLMLHLPLGIFYFTVMVTIVATSFAIAIWPIVALTAGIPMMTIPPYDYYATGWIIPVGILAGVILLTATMHLAKALGQFQGAIARALLVRG